MSSGLFVLYSTVPRLSPYTVGVVHSLQQLATCKVIALDCPGGACEVLHTVSGSFPCCITRDLPQQHVPCLGSGGAAVGQGQLDGVGGGCAEFSVHVISGHGPAHCGRILASLTLSCKFVGACSSCLGEAGQGLEVNPELADVRGRLVDGKLAIASGGWGVRAGVVRVPDVAGIGGDCGPTGICGDQAANSKSSRTVSIS